MEKKVKVYKEKKEWGRLQKYSNRIVFAATDPKTGVCGSCMNLNEENFFNHRISITGGVLENESSELLRLFFKSRRDKQ